MPTIDGTKVVENSARCFRAIGGGWGIKMNLPKGGEMAFGAVESRERADLIVEYLNTLKKQKRTSAEVMGRMHNGEEFAFLKNAKAHTLAGEETYVSPQIQIDGKLLKTGEHLRAAGFVEGSNVNYWKRAETKGANHVVGSC